MPKSDRVRLQHMLDAALEALAFAEGKRFEDLHRERLLVLGLVKAIEIIGEAASKVSAETRAAVPELPWEDIVAMRHRLVHAYFDIDLRVLWSTVEHDLPLLVEQLRRALETVRD
jgi:uncharacterized protein with HEPN domain